jgi:hypothetical protein
MTDRRHRDVDEWVPEPGSSAVAQDRTTPAPCFRTLRDSRAGFTMVTLATAPRVDLGWNQDVRHWGTYRRRPGRVSIIPTAPLPYSAHLPFEDTDDPTAPIAIGYVGPINWRLPSALLQIHSSLDRFPSISELEALALAACHYYGLRFWLEKVEYAIDVPYRPGRVANLRTHTYELRPPRRPTEEHKVGTREWRYQMLGSHRPIVKIQIREVRRADRRVVRLTVVCGRGVLKQAKIASLADLPLVPWRTWFFDRFRFVTLPAAGIGETLRASFLETAAARGVHAALTHLSPADRRLVRRRLVELPGPTNAATEALDDLEARLRATAGPLPRAGV